MRLECDRDYLETTDEFSKLVRFSKRTRGKHRGGTSFSKEPIVDQVEELTPAEIEEVIKGRMRLQNSKVKLDLVPEDAAWRRYADRHGQEISSMPNYLARQIIDIDRRRARAEGLK